MEISNMEIHEALAPLLHANMPAVSYKSKQMFPPTREIVGRWERGQWGVCSQVQLSLMGNMCCLLLPDRGTISHSDGIVNEKSHQPVSITGVRLVLRVWRLEVPAVVWVLYLSWCVVSGSASTLSPDLSPLSCSSYPAPSPHLRTGNNLHLTVSFHTGPLAVAEAAYEGEEGGLVLHHIEISSHEYRR